MKLFRYRKPSLKRMVGVTKVKKAVRKASGLNTIARNTNPSRIKQRVKQKVGLYSPVMRAIRQTAKGKVPMPMAPEISLTGSRKKTISSATASSSTYEVKANKMEELQCPRCGHLLGQPQTGYKGFFYRQEYKYFWCSGCSTKYNIDLLEGNWKCEFCSKIYSSKEECEEHEAKIHRAKH